MHKLQVWVSHRLRAPRPPPRMRRNPARSSASQKAHPAERASSRSEMTRIGYNLSQRLSGRLTCTYVRWVCRLRATGVSARFDPSILLASTPEVRSGPSKDSRPRHVGCMGASIGLVTVACSSHLGCHLSSPLAETDRFMSKESYTDGCPSH